MIQAGPNQVLNSTIAQDFLLVGHRWAEDVNEENVLLESRGVDEYNRDCLRFDLDDAVPSGVFRKVLFPLLCLQYIDALAQTLTLPRLLHVDSHSTVKLLKLLKLLKVFG